MSVNNNNKFKSEIENLQKQLTESIEHDNNNKLKIKDLEIQNSELKKKNMEFQSKLQELIIKNNLIQQEDSNLKLEIKKLQLSINSPGKVLASLGNVIKNDNAKNINNEILLKEKIELKESNDKLLLVISEREAEIVKNNSYNEKKLSMLQSQINELNGKLSDCNHNMKDMQEQINAKDKELQKVEENKNILAKYNLLKFEFEQYKKNIEKNKDLFNLNNDKVKETEKLNKNLNDRIKKIETSFNDMVTKGNIKVKDMNDLSMYVEINENLRAQIMEIQDKSDKFEKKYEQMVKNHEEENLEQYNKAVELQKNIDYLQDSFVQGTVQLNTELSELKSKVFKLETEKKTAQDKYKELLDNYEKSGENFVNIQKTMTKLREKDDFDITLIEERYIVLENMLDLEKNDLIAQNRELINQVRILNDNDNPTDKESIDVISNLKSEIQNLKDENKLLQNKLKDKENQIIQFQKQMETLKILQQETQSLKQNIKENNQNFKKIIDELTAKSSQLSEELLESRKRTSLLRSLPKFNKEDVKMKVDNTMMSAEVEKYQKENENLKNEIEHLREENSKLVNDVSLLKAQIANDTFTKDSEISKYKALSQKYKTMLEKNGLLKK